MIPIFGPFLRLLGKVVEIFIENLAKLERERVNLGAEIAFFT